MIALLIAIVVTVLDQVTKYAVRMSLTFGETRPVVDGFFDLTYLRNTGAAWGMLGGRNDWLTLISVFMLIFMILFRRSFLSDTLDHKIAFGLLLGGIVGNLIDRMKLGWVTDFLDFHVAGHHFPSFNIADSAICIGVSIYVFSSIWLSRHPLHEEHAAAKRAAEEDEVASG